MKALIARAYAPVEELVVADMPRPVAGAGQVLIAVEAAALNPFDVRMATGVLRDFVPIEHPYVLGMEASGVVAEIGAGVTGLRPGDAVVAFTFGTAGAIAEYTLAPAGPAIALRPDGMDAATAAGIPVAAMTARGLVDAAGLTAGGTALVIGATGAVGGFVVQLAARAGVRVLATAIPADADFIRARGAAEVIDYRSVNTVERALALLPAGVDVVFDLVNGGPALATTAEAARPGGLLVSPHHGGPDGFDREVSATYLHVEPADGLLQSLVDEVAAGALEVEVDRSHSIDEAPKAFFEFTTTHKRGKRIITF